MYNGAAIGHSIEKPIRRISLYIIHCTFPLVHQRLDLIGIDRYTGHKVDVAGLGQ